MNRENMCIDCRYCHKYKRLINGEWNLSCCCTVLAETGTGSLDDTVIHIYVTDTCEMFERRENDER